LVGLGLPGAVQRSGHECEHFLPMAWTRCIFHAQLKDFPTLLHLSLFLFFGGLVILLFHVDRKVFGPVFWWIGLFSILMVYVSITLLPLIQYDSPYHAPPPWFLYAGIPYVMFNLSHDNYLLLW
jgi:hypothetical protein